MRFDSEFSVPGTPDDVILRFDDVETMIGYLPGAEIEGRDEDGRYTGTLTVRIGPKRFVFRGRLRCETDPVTNTGRIVGRGATEAKTARIGIDISYVLHPAADDAGRPMTRVELVSEADMEGVIADIAWTGGLPAVRAMLDEFSARFAEGMLPTGDRAAAQPSPRGLPVRVMGITLQDLWRRLSGRLRGSLT